MIGRIAFFFLIKWSGREVNSYARMINKLKTARSQI